jgi:hypothetical protein
MSETCGGGQAMTTPSELAAIRERWAGAGPWFFTALGDIEDENGRLLAAFGTSAEGPLFAAAPTDIRTLLAALAAACAERDTALSRVAALEARMRELEGRRCRTCHYWNELRAKPGEGDCWRRMNCIGCEFNMPMAADDSCWAWSKDERRQEWYEPATEANTPPPSTPSRRRVDSERAAPVGERLDGKQEDSCR